jgi:hypothetical protein
VRFAVPGNLSLLPEDFPLAAQFWTPCYHRVQKFDLEQKAMQNYHYIGVISSKIEFKLLVLVHIP